MSIMPERATVDVVDDNQQSADVGRTAMSPTSPMSDQEGECGHGHYCDFNLRTYYALLTIYNHVCSVNSVIFSTTCSCVSSSQYLVVLRLNSCMTELNIDFFLFKFVSVFLMYWYSNCFICWAFTSPPLAVYESGSTHSFMSFRLYLYLILFVSSAYLPITCPYFTCLILLTFHPITYMPLFYLTY